MVELRQCITSEASCCSRHTLFLGLQHRFTSSAQTKQVMGIAVEEVGVSMLFPKLGLLVVKQLSVEALDYAALSEIREVMLYSSSLKTASFSLSSSFQQYTALSSSSTPVVMSSKVEALCDSTCTNPRLKEHTLGRLICCPTSLT